MPLNVDWVANAPFRFKTPVVPSTTPLLEIARESTVCLVLPMSRVPVP